MNYFAPNLSFILDGLPYPMAWRRSIYYWKSGARFLWRNANFEWQDMRHAIFHLFSKVWIVFFITIIHNYNSSSLVCVSLSWLSDLEKGENITDQHCTVENLLTCPTDSKINGVTVQSGRVPNSITFDGPVLCCSISSGNGILIPLLSLPSQLITSKIGKDF